MRHRSFNSAMRGIVREMARAERAKQTAANRAAAAHLRSLRAADRQAKANAREAARLYKESRAEEAQELSDTIQEQDAAISGLLENALKHPAQFEPLSQIKRFEVCPSSNDLRQLAACFNGVFSSPVGLKV